MMKTITIICGGVIALGVFIQLDKEEPEPVRVTRNDYEISKLKSRWFWYDSEVTASKEFTGKQFYQELRNEVETELKSKDICVRKSYMQGTIWESCAERDIHAR